MAQIRKIDAVSVLQICSAQVVVDLKSAVKELVENSLDAGCKSMDIKFFASGLNGFEVCDDGKGINEDDFEIIAKRGTTNKIREYDDIYAVKSLGFRGEALSSLCNIANVTIQTKKENWQTGWQIKFDHLGNLKEKTQIARKAGTQVIVKDLFRDLPVRLIEFKKNHKTQYAKTIQLLQQYAIISTKTRISILNNQGDGMPFTSVLRTNPNFEGDGLKDNICSILGKPKWKKLVKYEAELPLVKLSGYLTQTILSGSVQASKVNKEQNYCYLNGRPIDMPKKFRVLFNEMYKQYNSSMSPVIILSMQVEDDNYDINASPDKREVFLKNEKELLVHLKTHLADFFENIQRVKAYEAPQTKITNMDLLDSFKKIVSPTLTKNSAKLDSGWNSKKRTIDKISNDPVTSTEGSAKKSAEQSVEKKVVSELGLKILEQQKIKNEKKVSNDESSQRFSKLDDMLAKFKKNTKDNKGEENSENLSQMSQVKVENQEFGQKTPVIKKLDFDSFSYKNNGSGLKTKCFEPSHSMVSDYREVGQVKEVGFKGLTSSLKLGPPGQKRATQQVLSILDQLKAQEAEPLKPAYAKIDQQALKQTHQDFMNKFEMIEDNITKSKQGDSYDRFKIQNDASYGLGAIMNSYQDKVNRQNARVISDKNKYEVNAELREFENAQRQVNVRNKVKLADEELDSDGNQGEDEQIRQLQALNQQAKSGKDPNAEEDLDEPYRIVANFRSMDKRINFHNQEVIEINCERHQVSADKFVDLDIDKMKEWINIKLDQAKLAVEQVKQEDDIDIDNLISDKNNIKSREKESMANILIQPKQLESMFSKTDFMNLQIIGQFNKGFILAHLEDKGDLFIIDQHASDEKFNFEMLSRTTKISAQNLVCPIELDLSVTDALVVNQHPNVFKMNGFKVEQKQQKQSQQMDNTYLIRTLPMSKKITFTVDDFHELIQIVNEHMDKDDQSELFKDQFIHKEVMRPTKIYNMLASRACRQSIMIGRSLDHKLMTKVVSNLSTLQSPWNCPHGRPTLRFLRRMEQPQRSAFSQQRPPRLLYATE